MRIAWVVDTIVVDSCLECEVPVSSPVHTLRIM